MLIFLLMVLFAIGSVVFLCAFPFLRRPSDTLNRFGAPTPVETLGQAVTLGIARSFDLKGRCGRKEFWTTVILLGVVWTGFVVFAIWTHAVSNSGWPFYFIPVVWAVVSVMALSVSVRRLHDLNLSGWWVLIGFVFGYVVLLYLFCQPARGDDLVVDVF